MKRLAVVGRPIAHSQSPALFALLAEGAGCACRMDLVDGSDSLDMHQLANRMQLDGMLVTSPFKESFFEQADRHAPSALPLGATNLILREGDALVAYNVDPIGAKAAIESRQADGTQFGLAVLLGAGGAARAALCALKELGIPTWIVNRTPEHATEMAARVGWGTLYEAKSIPTHTLLVSALPPGSEVPDLPWAHFSATVDAVYYRSPLGPVSPILRPSGAMQWLAAQGLAAFEILMGVPHSHQTTLPPLPLPLRPITGEVDLANYPQMASNYDWPLHVIA